VKLSVKVEYACRVLAQLARSYGQPELAHIEDLARAEKIPANYLAQILTDLRNGGLIISRRGKQGGYALARKPEEITVFEIVKVIDGELLTVNAASQGQSSAAVRQVWEEIAGALEDKTKEYTLESLVTREGEEAMYYI
jgi:Rrf2 family transcriptional regulator, cysteine metabolism repressor